MSDSEFLDDIEENGNVSKSHSKLLEAVSQLDKGQRVKRVERSEPTLEVSEFHLVKSGVSDSNVVHVKDLAKALGKKSHHHEIVKNLETARKKANVLKKPLEKPAADRIKRIVGFENTKKELKKWNAIITTNRASESLRFPLNQPSMKLEPTKEFVQRFRIQSDLEKALAALEPQKENVKETDDGFSLTMKEIIMKRKETAKIRAQQSYREAKSRRERKIKSKKFHRVQRKEKIKLQLKEFEELKKTNPEAALEKLQQLDKTRAEERMSLRHKNTGKWAQSKQIRAKYDKDTRQELSQQLTVGRELTQKLKRVNDSEEENGVDSSLVQPSTTNAGNPWVHKTESEIDNFVKSYRKFWDKENNQLPNQSPKVNNNTESKKQELKISAENLDVANIFDESTVPPVNEKHKKLKDKHTNDDTKSLEIQSDKEYTGEHKSKIGKSKNANKTDESKKITRTIVLDDDKKLNKTDTKSLEVQSDKEYTGEHKSKIGKSKNANKTDESKKITRTIVLNDDKKMNKTDTKSLEVQSDKEYTGEHKSKIGKSKNANKTDESKKITRTIVLDDDKKMNKTVKLQKKDLKKAAATSMWNVESLEGDQIQQEFSSSSNLSNKEKINKLFNTMEDKIQDKIKSKLQRITKNYSQVSKKRKHKDHNAQEEDSFDGLEIQTANKKLVIDTSLHEGVDENDMESNADLEIAKNIAYSNSLSVIKPNTDGVNKSQKEIDPSKYMYVKTTHLHTDLPADITGGDDALDDSESEDERHNMISEAFADDDIVEDFRKEKEETVKASQPKDIDLTLPGWGRWGGKNIKPSKRKTKRIILKFPKHMPRKDENKGDVIIYEDDKAKIKEHQVSELPYPFTSVKDYEASIRMPIGRNFVPETAHRRLIEPTVKTSLGKIIEPMTEDVLVNIDKETPKKFNAKRRSKIMKKKKK